MYCILNIYSIKCKHEPRRYHGLEGFTKGEYYFAMEVIGKQIGEERSEYKKSFFRIYHSGDYYECCSESVFKKFFSVANSWKSEHSVIFNVWLNQEETMNKFFQEAKLKYGSTLENLKD